MNRYIYLHISDTNMCAYSIKHSFHKSLLLLSLSLASKSLQEQELHDLLSPWHFFHFLDFCIILCQQWALHQDVCGQSVPKGSDFNSEDNDIFDMYRHTKLLKKKQSSDQTHLQLAKKQTYLPPIMGKGHILNHYWISYSLTIHWKDHLVCL